MHEVKLCADNEARSDYRAHRTAPRPIRTAPRPHPNKYASAATVYILIKLPRQQYV
jgi:hypothetical protein